MMSLYDAGKFARLAILAAGLATLASEAQAALPQVTHLLVQAGGGLTWNSLAGTAGYNVYQGDIAGLRTGNYGACLIGSIQGTAVSLPDESLPVGTGVFFLVDGFDETGEGAISSSPAADPSPRCVPARRFFVPTTDGDAGDGIADGGDPLRNADILLHSMHHETEGVYLHDGELVLSAVDLGAPARGGYFEISSFSFGVENLAIIGSATGDGGARKVSLGELTITNRTAVEFPHSWLKWPHGARPICIHCHGGGMTASHVARSGSWLLARTYRSQTHYNGPLGQGWDSPTNARLAPSGSDVVYSDGAGRQETFIRLDAASFTSPAGRYARLVQNGDGSFTLRDPEGALQNFHGFDGSNQAGALESIQNRLGDRSAFIYDSQGLLTTVVDPLGRSIVYAYDANGRIVSITDFAGRQVVYTYDADGNLTTARSPIITGTPNGNDFPNGRTTTYAYSSGFADNRLNHNLTAIIRPDESGSGVPAAQIAYGSDLAAANFDRVISETIGGMNGSGVPAGGTLTFSYQSLNAGGNPADLTLPRRQATVFDRNGNQKRFVHNINGNCISRTDFTNRGLRSGEPDYTTQSAYDSDGELILVLRPEGDQTQFAYDKPGADRYREGNLIMVRSVADTLASGGRGNGHGGESNDRVWTFTYEPVFNQIASATEPRGNDPTFVPQNGGANTPGRFTRTWLYDDQEGDPALDGINAYAGRFGISLAGGVFGLGDLNGDGTTMQAAGNAVLVSAPTVTLDPASSEAGILGSTLQAIHTTIQWNGHGQPTALADAEENQHTFMYYPETDPDGDGTPTPPPPDGRVLDAVTGGYLATEVIDANPQRTRNRDNGVNPTPAQIQYDLQYDPAGDLAAVIDGRGVETRFTHNAVGELVLVRRAAATADDSGPDGTPPTGRGETGLTAFSFQLRYAYDADGNVVTVQRGDRGATRGVGGFVTTTRTFDLLDDLVQVDRPATSALTLTTEYRYDANQNLTRTTEPEGNSHDRAWDERDLLLTSTRGSAGQLGGAPSTRQYAYDGDGDITRLTDGRGGIVDYHYDGHDRLTRTVDPIGDTTGFFYDPAGDLVRRLSRGPVGGPTPPDRSGTMNVDLADVRGLYDETRRRIRTDTMLFVPAGVTPARPAMLSEGPLLPGDGAVNTLFEYDRLSRLTFVHNDSGVVTRLDYDGAGRAIRTTDPAGDAVDRAYDAGSDLIETVATDLATTPQPEPDRFLTTYYYDALGRGTMTVDNLGETWRSIYDSLDALVTASDANGPAGGSINRRSPGYTGMSVAINSHGNVTRYAYDAADRLLSTVQTLTATGMGDGSPQPEPDLSNPANQDGLITRTTIWSDNSLPAQTLDDKGNATTYAYDDLDRRVRVTRPDGTSRPLGYDAEDHVVSTTDPNGTQVTNTFDLAGRLTMVQVSPVPEPDVSGTTQRTYEYDGLSRPTRAFDNNQPADATDDATVTFLRDSLGRTIEEARIPPPAAGTTRYSDLGWQAAGLLTSLTYPSGDQVQYSYDGSERLRAVNDTMHPELAATFDYMGLGRILTRVSGNGVRLTFLDDTGTLDTGYDGVGRPVRMRHLDPANALLAGFDYRYDRVGNRTAARRLHDTDGSGNARGDVYAYDSARRLISFQEAYLDAGFNVVSAPSDSGAFTLDGPGNWASLTRNGSLFLNTPNNLNEYDENQCCGTHTDDGVADDFLDLASTPAPDGLNLTYDKNGDQTNTVLQSLAYNFASLPVAARTPANGTAVSAYAYDAVGRRSKRQVMGGAGTTGTSTFTYGGGRFPGAVEEDDGVGALVRQFGFGPGGRRLWQLQADGSSQYLLEDALGSAAALTTGNGAQAILERVVYDPYGKPTFENAASQPLKDNLLRFIPESVYHNAYLFRGMRYDPELGARSTSVNTDFGGLYAVGGYYNPNEGRAMTPQPEPDMPALGMVPMPEPDLVGLGLQPQPSPDLPGSGMQPQPEPDVPGLGMAPVPEPDLPGFGMYPQPEPELPGFGMLPVPEPDMPGFGMQPVPQPDMLGLGMIPQPEPDRPGVGMYPQPEPDMPGFGMVPQPTPDMPGFGMAPVPQPDMPGLGMSPMPLPDLPGFGMYPQPIPDMVGFGMLPQPTPDLPGFGMYPQPQPDFRFYRSRSPRYGYIRSVLP